MDAYDKLVSQINGGFLNPSEEAQNICPIVTGEYRGSTIVERYLDVNLTDYGTPIGNVTGADPNAFPALSSSYRFRKIDHHQFAP